MFSALDPSVRYNLQKHAWNMYEMNAGEFSSKLETGGLSFAEQKRLDEKYRNYKPPESTLTLGTIRELVNEQQLGTATKISLSEKVSDCFNRRGTVCFYPELSERESLVALVDRPPDVQVIAVYSFEQMQEIECERDHLYQDIVWSVLEISKELETELLKGVNLETGEIIWDPKVLWG